MSDRNVLVNAAVGGVVSPLTVFVPLSPVGGVQVALIALLVVLYRRDRAASRTDADAGRADATPR